MKVNFIKKATALMIASIIICGAFTSCGDKEDTQTNDNTEKTEITSKDVTEDNETLSEDTDDNETLAEDTSDETELPDEPLTPIDIETPGGVVVVGKVCKDDDGWYLAPETPLNVNFTYYEDPLVYDELTKIRFFTVDEDGIEKSLYNGQTVTVSGTFSVYRDLFDKLYIFPYSIKLGKLVTESYAAPDLEAPDTSQTQYNPSIPLPDIMKPTVNNGHYEYNVYMLSLETLETMGNDYVDFYIDFVDAFLNHEEKCHCPEEMYAEMLTSVVYYEFPLYDACAEFFNFFEDYDDETKTITIKYKYGKEEHDAVIEEFFKSANEMLATTAPGQSEQRMAQNIYHELCTRMTYDYSALDDISRKEARYAYLEHTGVCITFANVYNQLLTRVGIEATVAACEYDLTSGHAWSAVKLNDKWYFCDPTFELSFNDGTAYRYFGTNYDERLKAGLGENGITFGRFGTITKYEDIVADEMIKII